MAQGRFDEAEVIIRDVARVNNVTIPDVLFEEHEKETVTIHFVPYLYISNF